MVILAVLAGGELTGACLNFGYMEMSFLKYTTTRNLCWNGQDLNHSIGCLQGNPIYFCVQIILLLQERYL